jgi:DNA modification methylase
MLNNSCLPGDTILDFMAGTGSLVVAAHQLKMKTILIERDASSYGRCVERVKSLVNP